MLGFFVVGAGVVLLDGEGALVVAVGFFVVQASGWCDVRVWLVESKRHGQGDSIGQHIRVSGYTHDDGPCEVWLDNVMVMKGDNCHSEYPDQSHKIDYSSCEGKCMLRWYWFGIRPLSKVSWQIYKECIPLKGTGEATSDSDATTPAPTTKKPTAATKTPSPSSSMTRARTTTAPAPTTKTPSPTTKAQCLPRNQEAFASPFPTTSAPVKNCKRRGD